MERQHYLTALGIVLAISLFCYADQCTDPKPVCQLPGTNEMLFVQDPKNCSQYFQCMKGPNGYAIPLGPFSCPSGNEYLEEFGKNGFNPPCAIATECHKKCNCLRDCLKDGDMIPTHNKCTHYFRCQEKEDNPGHFTKNNTKCPDDNPYFNGAECDYTEQFCCPHAA
ncbi:unnamed protein product [Meganyctiphanes norvegica]|uniref:Chitin-binding type-2 domain-containing protein n=1 Tax=Meganyctiphanes norvegica TaxID=48144 RepID=A0AAV2SEV7_MEGNR